MISIIVPIYNSEKYLDCCIQSILAQTYIDFEVLLVDDGSTDSSGAICDKYAEQDHRVRVFHKENGGASSARKLGLDNAGGEWIIFCDSDDSLKINALERLASYISRYSIVIANTPYKEQISGDEYIRRLLECKIRCELWGGVYQRDLLRNLQCEIPATIVIGEDFLVNLQCGARSDSVMLIDDEIYVYNDIPGSLVNSVKLTVQHETELLSLIYTILNDSAHRFSASIFRKKYLMLERLVYTGAHPYNEGWVKDLMREKREYAQYLGIKERILLTIPWAYFCRNILKLGIYIKQRL